MKEQTAIGNVARITFHNPENGYTVARLRPKGKNTLLTVVGALPGVMEGQDLEVKGRVVKHAKFGEQFEVQAFRILPPSDSLGVVRYLSSGLIKGVGPKLAQAMVDSLGEDILEIIEEHPQRLSQVPGIGPKRVKSIRESIKAHGELREVMIFLQGHGVGASTALRIYRQYGAGTLAVLKNNPHRLAADMRGIGFATADAIASRLGIARDHPSRLQAGIMHTLNQALDQGHVYLPYDELMDSAAKLLGVERGLLGVAYARLHNERRLIQEEFNGEKDVYPAIYHTLEVRCAKALADLAGRDGLLNQNRATKAVAWVSGQMQAPPSAAQAKALELLLVSGLSVLTGGPGTGKTTLVKALLTIAQRMGTEVALAAPTGRAAKRMHEATGQPAQTLHRLLEYSPKENKFLRNGERPLEFGLVVVDECSMVDLWLMTSLAEAIGPWTKLVLVGDANQLPSVGPGLVLGQIIQSKVVNAAEIKEIFRQDQAGLIVKNAHLILHGQMPVLPAKGDKSADFYFIAQPDPEKAADLVAELACKRIPQNHGLDPLSDIQVLAPMHRGKMGCQTLNRIMRSQLNPAAKLDGPLARGDKVMQVRNDYDLEVFNGDVGQVERVGEETGLINLGGREVSYPIQDMDNLLLAYAVTVHKSQGSEYPAVVIALGMEHFIMLNRQLLYTAVTRGRQLVIVVGHPTALQRAIETADPSRRYARLDDRLINIIKK